MPLIHGKSKKALQKNIRTEIEAGKPVKEALGIAYSVKRKAKKMANGGMPSSPQKQKDYNTNADLSTANTSSIYKPAEIDVLKSAMKAQGLAKGGSVKSRIKPIKHPRMVEGRLKVKHRNDLDEEMMAEGGALSAVDEKRPMPEDRYDDAAEMEQHEVHGEFGSEDEEKAAHSHRRGHVFEEIGAGPEEDEVEHPENEEEDDDQRRPAVDEYMADHEEMLAEGGMLDDEDEPHHSIADRILARKRRNEGPDDMADLDMNAIEEPNNEDDESYNALRKENYSEDDALNMDQPEDSNEFGDEEEKRRSDPHDRVDMIMRRRKKRM